jgi:hypothetical protein
MFTPCGVKKFWIIVTTMQEQGGIRIPVSIVGDVQFLYHT